MKTPKLDVIKLSFLIAFFAMYQFVIGQNCINNVLPNGNFEEGILPDFRGQIDRSTDWSAATGDPDLFDEDVLCLPACNNPGDFTCVDVPCNHFGFEEQRNGGKRYAGLWSALSISARAYAEIENGVGFREFDHQFVEAIQHRLKNPMNTCKEYTITFYVSAAEKGEIDDFINADCSSFRVKLSQGPQNQDIPYMETDAVEVYSGSVCQKNGWQKVSFTIQPQSEYDYIIIESGLNTLYTEFSHYTSGTNSASALDMYLVRGTAVAARLHNADFDVAQDFSPEDGYWINAYMYVDDISVEENNCQPPFADAGNDKTICEGNSVTLGGSPTGYFHCGELSYEWFHENGSRIYPSGSTITVSPNKTTTYTVVVKSERTGLTASDQVTVNVIPSSLGSGMIEMCEGSCVNLCNEEGLESLNNHDFYWVNQNNPNETYSTKYPEVCPNSTTTYHLTATNRTYGCETTYEYTVEVSAPPTVIIDGVTAVCDGESAFLTAKASDGKPGYTYQWYDENGLFSEKAFVEVKPNKTTTYTLIVKDRIKCESIQQHTVKVLTADAGGPYAVCAPGSVSLGGNPLYEGSQGQVTTVWKTKNGNVVSNSSHPTVTVNSDIRYYLEVTDASGCTAQSTAFVDDQKIQKLDIGKDYTFCRSANNNCRRILYSTMDIVGPEGSFEYNWTCSNSNVTINNANDRNPTACYSQNGTFVFTVTVTALPSQCTATKSVTVTVTDNCSSGGGSGPGSGANIITLNECVNTGGSIVIGPSSDPGSSSHSYSYLWDVPRAGITISNRYIRNPVVSGVVGLDKFYLRIKNETTSEYTFYTVNVAQRGNMVLDAGRDFISCDGECFTLGESPVAYGGNGGFTYSWSDGSQIISSSETPEVCPNSDATYTVTVTDKYGCSLDDQVDVEVLATPLANAGSDYQICTGPPVSPITIGGNPSKEVSSDIAEWVPEVWVNSVNPTTGDASISPQGTITYTLTVKDHNGGKRTCATSDEVDIIIGNVDVADAGDDGQICEEETVTIGKNTYNKDFTYQWTPETGLDNPNLPVTEATPNTTTTYVLTISDGNCSTKDSITITVNPLPLAEAGDRAFMCQHNSVTIGGAPTASFGTPGSAPNAYTYAWSPGNYNTSNPSVSPNKDTEYFVTVTDSKGCKHTDSVDVWVTLRPNLMFNGGFEQGLVPTTAGEIEKAEYWSRATGLPDYYDYKATCVTDCNTLNGLGCYGVPCNHWGEQPHWNYYGGHYAGLLSAIGGKHTALVVADLKPTSGLNQLNPDARLATEAIETKMRTHMRVGKKYEICLKASNALGGLVFDDLLHDVYQKKGNILVKLSEYSTDWQLLVPFSPSPAKQVKSFRVDSIGEWQDLCFEYVADKEYRYLTIENGFPQGNVSHTLQNLTTNDLVRGDSSILTSNVSVDVNKLLTGTPPTVSVGLNLPVDANLVSYVYVDEVSVLQECIIDTNTIVIRDTVELCVEECEGENVNVGTDGLGNIVGKPQRVPVPCPEGVATVLETGSDNNGNPVTKEITLVPTLAPKADAGPDLYLCEGTCGQIGGNPTGAGTSGQYSYKWTPEGGLSDPTSPNPIVCSNYSRVYYLEVMDSATGCVGIDEVIVHVGDEREVVRNGGLEDGVEPETIGDADAAQYWFLGTGDPELFDVDLECLQPCIPQKTEPYCIDIPCNFAGYQELREQGTDRYAGLMAITAMLNSDINADTELPEAPFLSSIPEAETMYKSLNNIYQDITEKEFPLHAVEAIESRLLEPLKIGTTYDLSLWVAKAHDNFIAKENLLNIAPSTISTLATAEVVVKLSTVPVNNDLYRPTNAKIIYRAEVDSKDWTEIAYSFTADSAYQYIIVESNLKPTLNFTTSLFGGASPSFGLGETYFYVDDISIKEPCINYFESSTNNPENLQNMTERNQDGEINNQFVLYPNPSDNNLFIYKMNTGELDEESKVSIVELSGRVIYSGSMVGNNMSLDVSNLANGIYRVIIQPTNKERTIFNIMVKH